MNDDFDSPLISSDTNYTSLFSDPFRVILSEDNNLFLPSLEMGNRNTTTSSTTTLTGDEEYTQIVSIFGFAALVLIAIFAWLFSRHCCFLEKPTLPGDVRRPRPQHFNFLGAQVIRRLRSNSVASTRTRTDDPPPAYEDLFPTIVVVPNPQQDSPPYVPPADAPETKVDLNKEARRDSKDTP